MKHANVGRLGRRYSTIRRGLWEEESFRRLRPDGQLLYLYSLTGSHVTALQGLSRIGEAALAEEIGWPPGRVRAAMFGLQDDGLVVFDTRARVLWVPAAITHDTPNSPNAVTAWGPLFHALPDCEAKALWHKAIVPFTEGLEEGLRTAFGATRIQKWSYSEAASKPLATDSEAASNLARASASGSRSPIPDPGVRSQRPESDPGVLQDSAPTPRENATAFVQDSALRASEPVGSGTLFALAPGNEPERAAAKEVPSKAPKPARVPKPGSSWSSEFGDMWIARFGGTAPFGRIGKALSKLVENNGREKVKLAWKRYLDAADARYIPGPEKFADTYGHWAGTAEPAKRSPRDEWE
jgi:hypothetical protein